MVNLPWDALIFFLGPSWLLSPTILTFGLLFTIVCFLFTIVCLLCTALHVTAGIMLVLGMSLPPLLRRPNNYCLLRTFGYNLRVVYFGFLVYEWSCLCSLPPSWLFVGDWCGLSWIQVEKLVLGAILACIHYCWLDWGLTWLFELVVGWAELRIQRYKRSN